jgi:D-glycero-D-manno-heptose 1,7-bisphosphate phosphatase
MANKSIFLDRDGVINHDKNYLHKVDDFEFIKGIFVACRQFNTLDYKIIIVTNQSGISRGYYTEEDYQKLTHWMITQFKEQSVNILDVFHCPHTDNFSCQCRKPKPGMLLKAKSKHSINMKKSWMIGDKERDIAAANAAGIEKTILLRSSYEIYKPSNASFTIDSILESIAVIQEIES